jgi:hypothetical protein
MGVITLSTWMLIKVELITSFPKVTVFYASGTMKS